MIKKILSHIFKNKAFKLIALEFIHKGKNLTLKSEFISSRVEIGQGSSLMEGVVLDSLSKIGNNVYIGRYCYITKTRIGNYCSIANNVSIGQGKHDLSRISTNSVFYENPFEELTKGDCVIGDDVWIGVDSIVLRGVEVGRGAVIGANSVVTKDVPPYAIMAGSPARLIRYRFDTNKIENIEKSLWWEKSIESARLIISDLDNIHN